MSSFATAMHQQLRQKTLELVYSHLFNPDSLQRLTACGVKKMDERSKGHEGVRVMMSLDLIKYITQANSHSRGHTKWGPCYR